MGIKGLTLQCEFMLDLEFDRGTHGVTNSSGGKRQEYDGKPDDCRENGDKRPAMASGLRPKNS